MSDALWSIYFIRCRGGEIYTGICTDVERRFSEHAGGGPRAARFVRGRGPLTLLASYPVGDRSLALRLEARIKKLKPEQKRRVSGSAAAVTGLIAGLQAGATKGVN